MMLVVMRRVTGGFATASRGAVPSPSAKFSLCYDSKTFRRILQHYRTPPYYELIIVHVRRFHRPEKLRKRVLIVTLLLLLFFTGLIAWAWIVNDLQNCGCFGKLIAMRPAWSILKNAIFMFLIILCLCARQPGENTAGRIRLRSAAIAASLLLPLAAVIAFANNIDRETTTPPPEKLSDIRFEYHDRLIDLSQGQWLVAMLSPECPHCIAAIPRINALANDNNIPEIIGLIPESETPPEAFAKAQSAVFPLYALPPLTFFHLTRESPPVFVLLSQGRMIKTWSGQPPEPVDILFEIE